MSVGRAADGLLSAPATLRLLGLLSAKPQSAQELQSSLQLLESASFSRTWNTLGLLAELDLISTTDGLACLSIAPQSASGFGGIVRERLTQHYVAFLRSASIGTLFQLKHDDGRLWVDRMQLPGRNLGLPYVLLEFGVFCRDGPESRFWWAADDTKGVFLDLIDDINRSTTKPFSLRRLKALQSAQEEAGGRAEQFVVGFERASRSLHPFRERIRSISDDDVGAGFDILSFETDTALLHDKYIEVKSYSGNPAFFWSAGEVAAAEELQDRYWLYLVDRERLHDAGYAPEMIQNPYTHFISRTAEGWLRENDGYRFERQS